MFVCLSFSLFFFSVHPSIFLGFHSSSTFLPTLSSIHPSKASILPFFLCSLHPLVFAYTAIVRSVRTCFLNLCLASPPTTVPLLGYTCSSKRDERGHFTRPLYLSPAPTNRLAPSPQYVWHTDEKLPALRNLMPFKG